MSMTGENEFQANVVNPYTYKYLFHISELQVLLKCEIWRLLLLFLRISKILKKVDWLCMDSTNIY